MNSQEFVEAIKLAVLDTTIKSVQSMLIKPSGRSPLKKLVEMSDWFNELDEKDKTMLLKIVKETAETSVFGFLCVLDGVKSIENTSEIGELNLYFEKDGVGQLLNGPEEEYLHDLFKEITYESGD